MLLTGHSLPVVVLAGTVAVCTLLSSCNGNKDIIPDPVPPKTDECQAQMEVLVSEAANVEAGFNYALVGAEVDADASRLTNVKTGFDQIQRDYDISNMRLCRDHKEGRITGADYVRRRDCLDDSLRKMRLLTDMMKSDSEGARQKAWMGENQVAALVNSMDCTAKGTTPPSLDPPRAPTAAPDTPPPADSVLTLKTEFICQRQTSPGVYEDVPECNGQKLREDDRFKIGFSTDKASRVYLMIYNDSGQFQMLFPAPGGDNEAIPNRSYYLPGAGADDWFVLDDVSGVLEVIQVIASNNKIPELEDLRGADIPPSGGKPTATVVATRGIIEPVIFRGVKTGKGFKQASLEKTDVKMGDQAVSTIPTVTSRANVVGAEFNIYHVE